MWLMFTSFVIAILPVLYSIVDKQPTCGPFQYAIASLARYMTQSLIILSRVETTSTCTRSCQQPSTASQVTTACTLCDVISSFIYISAVFREPLLLLGTPALLVPIILLLS